MLVKLQTAVCNVAVLYMEKYDADDEFLPHAPSFVNAIWPLVVDLPREQRNDRVRNFKTISFSLFSVS